MTNDMTDIVKRYNRYSQNDMTDSSNDMTDIVSHCRREHDIM